MVMLRGYSDKFVVGRDSFDSIEINPTPKGQFFYFSHKQTGYLIKEFVLAQQPQVDYVCHVALIKKGNRFAPRLEFSIRDKSSRQIAKVEAPESAGGALKARVDLGVCHDAAWQLVEFLRSLREVEVPGERFSLVSQNESQIVDAIRGRDQGSVLNIIRGLAATPGLRLSEADVSQLLQRREKLEHFKIALHSKPDDERWWQTFFDRNKWIFGYGLNYQILKHERSQPVYGGTRVDGRGGQRGDTLASTVGDVNFTVLVEIKTPKTPLLTGTEEVRSGAWSLSKDLTDALVQLQANTDTWNRQGSLQEDNRDRLEAQDVFTVQPKGILVIGTLSEVQRSRSKRGTFQRFRMGLHGIDVLTFDELLRRAEFIVSSEKTE
jgi:hypothetical protein